MATTLLCHAPGVDPTALLAALGDDSNLASIEDLRAADRSAGRVLFILISPAESARRSQASLGWSFPRALAHYERAIRTTIESISGLPVVIADEGTEAPRVLSALESLHNPVDENNTPRLDMGSAADTAEVPSEINTLWSRLQAAFGTHQSFALPDLGIESAWTSELLGLTEELGQVGEALVFASEQLAVAMHDGPDDRFESSRKWPEASGDQFHEPGEGEPYRLNASEDREAYHAWLAWQRQPAVVGGQESKARTQPATRPRPEERAAHKHRRAGI